MLIFVLEEQTYYMQHLTMKLGNQSLKLIIADRHIVSLKNGLYMIKEKNQAKK